MEIGLFTEFQCPPGMDEARAFDESLAEMTAAEEMGFDAVWLAEIHFQKDRSVLSSPLLVATAIAARTRRVKIGIAVQVLPLAHPLRLAEDVATLDHLSKGRLDFGVGRSGLPEHYQRFIGGYHEGWREAGHPGLGPVALIVPVYVAASSRRAREEPEASTMHFFRVIAEALGKGGTRREEAARLGRMSYDEILQELVVYGAPEAVTERLLELREALGYTTLSVWMNVGGRIPHERVLCSMRLFTERVVPRLS
jgi:alkanesulfonate monooxygenase SsuD/methylene tetrahydromethanopterin reductase-like flavin-dependent oxidoreductase (luciferase family)